MKPIACTVWSVEGILADRKSQTRRLIKPQPEKWDTVRREPYVHPDWPNLWSPLSDHSEDRISPYRVGERLWVRETWLEDSKGYVYRADGNNEGIAKMLGGWQPPMFMPRHASRITLEITDVRVEHIQDITSEDALAEGVEWEYDLAGRVYKFGKNQFANPIYAYQAVWNHINHKSGFGWDTNPWVWVVSFEHELCAPRK